MFRCERPHQPVRRIGRQRPNTFQYVVHMGLRHARDPRQAAFGELSRANSLASHIDQPLLQLPEVHPILELYFSQK